MSKRGNEGTGASEQVCEKKHSLPRRSASYLLVTFHASFTWRRGNCHGDGVERKAEVVRETRETQITLKLNIDGSGQSNISTGVGFLDHLLELFAKHGFFDLEVNAAGDLHVDAHHTVEDVGICLGEAFMNAVGDKAGMRRFGSFTVPMYEALAQVDLDLCGRSYLHYQTPLNHGKGWHL